MLLFGGILCGLPSSVWPQLVLGQYEDEAPFRTWNTFGFSTAAALGRGETVFALAADCAASLTNPALLSWLPKITVAVNGSFNFASFYKYSFVNTGVLYSKENIPHGFYALDFAGLSFRLQNWTLAFTAAATECYTRPPAIAEYKSGGILYYKIDLRQTGILRNINFSISRKIGSRLSAGLGLNFLSGTFEKKYVERWELPTEVITDRKSHDFQGFFLNGGLYFHLSDKFQAAAVFRTPFSRKAKSQSYLNYNAPAGHTDITIAASADSTYTHPLVLGLGACYIFSPDVCLAADLTYFNWSSYSVKYFGETLPRNFKDVVKVGVGIEYKSSFRLFSQNIDTPIRFGLVYDPQPMKEPCSSYYYLSFGSAFQWKHFSIDIGTLLGKERGSGNNLSARKVALSINFHL